MRKLKILTSVFICALLFVACGQKNNNQSNDTAKNVKMLKDAGNFDDFEIYYLNEAGDEVEITEQQFKNFIVNTRDDISDENEIKNIAVVATNTKKDELIFAEIKNVGKYAVFITPHSTYSKGFVLTGKDVICKATNCPTCRLTISDGVFSCSSCEDSDGECVKTTAGNTSGTFSKSMFE